MEGGSCLRVAGNLSASSHVVQFDLQPTVLAPWVSHCRTAPGRTAASKAGSPSPGAPDRRGNRGPRGRGVQVSFKPSPTLGSEPVPLAACGPLCTRVLDKGASSHRTTGRRSFGASGPGPHSPGWGDLGPPTARSGSGDAWARGLAGRFVRIRCEPHPCCARGPDHIPSPPTPAFHPLQPLVGCRANIFVTISPFPLGNF